MPNWVTLVTIDVPVHVGADLSWNNTILAAYNPRNTDARVYTSYTVASRVNNTMTNLTIAIPFPATNAVKHLNWTAGAGGSAAVRNFGSPWKIIYQ